MNSNPTAVFASKLFHSPDILTGEIDVELQAQILRYAKGDLTLEDAAIVAELMQDDAGVAAYYKKCRETLKFEVSTEGQARLVSPLASAATTPTLVLLPSLPPQPTLLSSNTTPSGMATTDKSHYSSTSQFKGISELLSDYRSNDKRNREAAGDTLTEQNFGNRNGYPLESPCGELRFFWNLRERNNGTTSVTFALKLPNGMPSASVRWERLYSDGVKPPEVNILKFTTKNYRIELPDMKSPDGAERWSFDWLDTGGAL